ncbi:MAG: glycosyltransferase [Desulfobacteraceae bacterium]
MPEPIKILHLVTWLNPGGIERWLISMLREIDRERVAMDFCCKGPTTGILTSQAEALGAKVYHCPLKPTHLGFMQGLSKIIRHGSYQIVHNHLQIYAGVGVYAAKRCGVPVITGFHNTAFPAQSLPNISLLHKLRHLYGRLSIGYALRHSELVSVNAMGILHYLREGYSFPKSKERVLYYGVEVFPHKSEKEKRAFRDAIGLDPEKLLITHVGRFAPQKNHEGLVRVAEKVIAQEPRAHFVLVGDGILRKQIEQMTNNKSIAKNFSFLGLRQDVEDILGFSAIFFLPSKWEGLPRAVLEAMAAKLPIVASDLPGLQETVQEGESGYLVPVNDEEGLAHRLLELLSTPEKRRNMGEAGCRRVEAKFSLEAAIKNLRELYESLGDPECPV